VPVGNATRSQHEATKGNSSIPKAPKNLDLRVSKKDAMAAVDRKKEAPLTTGGAAEAIGASSVATSSVLGASRLGGGSTLVTSQQRSDSQTGRGLQVAATTGRSTHFAFDVKPKSSSFLGLPKIFWALLADAVAMLAFAACIPFVLTVAKRKKLPCS